MARIAVLALTVVTLVAAGCGGEEVVQPRPETVEGTVATPELPEGDPDAGGEVFASAGCGSCHTFGPAGSQAQIGPDLDQSLEDDDAESIRQSIVNPNAEIAEGFTEGVMPTNYGQQLSDQELADLVAFLSQEG